TVGLTTPKAYIEWNLEKETVAVNGDTSPLAELARISGGKLLVKLTWIAPYMNVQYTYEPNPSRVELKYVTPTGEMYKESGYPEDNQPNSRPMAKFAPDKPFYRIGEPVKLIDLSYDPDAEGLPDYEWSGKQD